MADDEKAGEDTSAHGNEWEVVSLTASAYASAPGPKAFDPLVKSKNEVNNKERVDSAAMFMPDDFIFPPHGHKQLLTEPDCSEIPYGPISQDLNHSEEFSRSLKPDDDNLNLRSVDGLQGIQFFDKRESLSDHDVEFVEGKVLEELTMAGKEPDIYVDATFSSFHSKYGISQPVVCGQEESGHHASNLSYHDSGYPFESANAANLNEGAKVDGPDLPCEAWWKRHAISVYKHARETNTFWSVFVAAAVMGFVILGQHWQRKIAASAP